MSILNFLFKSKEQAERDKRELEAASYPYGAAQREKLEALLEALLPEEPEQLRRTIFLLVKRAYAKDLSNPLEDSAPLRENLPDTFRTLDRQLFGRHKGKRARYLALVLADSRVDETLAYPDAEALREEAERLAPQCLRKKSIRKNMKQTERKTYL